VQPLSALHNIFIIFQIVVIFFTYSSVTIQKCTHVGITFFTQNDLTNNLLKYDVKWPTPVYLTETLREEHGFQMLENKMLRKIFVPERAAVNY
jgi:hypothetical protein